MEALFRNGTQRRTARGIVGDSHHWQLIDDDWAFLPTSRFSCHRRAGQVCNGSRGVGCAIVSAGRCAVVRGCGGRVCNSQGRACVQYTFGGSSHQQRESKMGATGTTTALATGLALNHPLGRWNTSEREQQQQSIPRQVSVRVVAVYHLLRHGHTRDCVACGCLSPAASEPHTQVRGFRTHALWFMGATQRYTKVHDLWLRTPSCIGAPHKACVVWRCNPCHTPTICQCVVCGGASLAVRGYPTYPRRDRCHACKCGGFGMSP